MCCILQSQFCYTTTIPQFFFVDFLNSSNKNTSKQDACCCIIQCKLEFYHRLISTYHLHHWKDENGVNHSTQCFIYPIYCVITGILTVILHWSISYIFVIYTLFIFVRFQFECSKLWSGICCMLEFFLYGEIIHALSVSRCWRDPMLEL